MGQIGPFRTAPLLPRWAMAAMLLVAMAMTWFLLSAQVAEGLPEQRDGEWWSTLELDVSPADNTIEVQGDTATFKAHVFWGGSLADNAVVLSIQPLPEGWTYQLGGAAATSRGFRLLEEGQVEVTIHVDDDTAPGTYYMEPRLEHPTEPITLVSAPLNVRVTSYSVTMGASYLPAGPAYPGDRIEGEIDVSADEPVDRVVAVRVVWAPRGWSVGFHPALAYVKHGAPSSLTMTIRVDELALPGEYVVMLVTDTGDPRAEEAAWDIPVIVGVTRGLRIASEIPPLEVGFGAWASANVVVESSGNVPTPVYSVSTLQGLRPPEGWGVMSDGLPATVPPFGRATFTVRVGIPSNPVMSPSGTTQLTLVLTTGRPDEDLRLTLEVHVPEAGDLVLLPLLESTSREVTAPQNASFEYSSAIVLKDAGNLRDVRTVRLNTSFDLPILSADLSQTSVLLASGMEIQLRISVRIHHAAYPGQYVVRVVAADAAGATAEMDLGFTVTGARIVLVEDLTVERVIEDVEMDSVSTYSSVSNMGLYRVTGQVYSGEATTLDYVEVRVYDSSDSDMDYLGSVPIEDLSPGGTENFSFTFPVDGTGERSLQVRLVVPGKAIEDPDAAHLEEDFQAVPTPTPDGEGTPLFFAMAAAVGALAGLIAILGTEAGRFALMAFILVPLYTRLRPEQVTDHFVRGQILGYIKANPGETYTRIRKALGVSNGQFIYHSRILESQGFIRSVKDGANRRFYPAGMRIPHEVKDVELNQVQRIIYTIILEYPGINQSRIARMMNLSPSTVNYHVNIMTKVGVVERRRSGRLSLCFVVDDIL